MEIAAVVRRITDTVMADGTMVTAICMDVREAAMVGLQEELIVTDSCQSKMGVCMKVKYIGISDSSLTNGKPYDVIEIERGLYRIIDETGEDFLFWPDEFIAVNEFEEE